MIPIPGGPAEMFGVLGTGWFRALFASMRNWTALVSVMLNDLLADRSSDHCPMPFMLDLPRFPTLPGSGYFRRTSPAVPSGLRAARAEIMHAPVAAAPVVGLASMRPRTVPILSPMVTIDGS